MKLFKATFDVIIMRYYLMMAVVVISFSVGMPYLAILSLPIFLSAILGIEFRSISISKKSRTYNRNILIPTKKYQQAS